MTGGKDHDFDVVYILRLGSHRLQVGIYYTSVQIIVILRLHTFTLNEHPDTRMCGTAIIV